MYHGVRQVARPMPQGQERLFPKRSDTNSAYQVQASSMASRSRLHRDIAFTWIKFLGGTTGSPHHAPR
jgi:hypothetical protein